MNAVNSPDAQVPPTRSKVLIGEGSGLHLDKVSIREFRGETVYDPSHPKPSNLGLLAFTLVAFCNDDPRTRISPNILQELDMDEDLRIPYSPGSQVFPLLRENLIHPKVVTGDIRELVIADTGRDELPKAMVSKFHKTAMQSIEDTPLEGHEAFYKVFGRLRLGSKMASVACGICISPQLRIYNKKSTFNYRTQVQRLPQTGLNDEVAAWMDIVAESRARIADNLQHPFSGGIMNPR